MAVFMFYSLDKKLDQKAERAYTSERNGGRNGAR